MVIKNVSENWQHITHITQAYWAQVVEEVKHKNDGKKSFHFTNVGPEKILDDKIETTRRSTPSKIKKRKRFYFTNPAGIPVYFTRREYECLTHLLQNKSISDTAKALSISYRTAEYFIVCMRKKLNCSTKKDLINVVRNYMAANGNRFLSQLPHTAV